MALPTKTPLNAVHHGRIERDEYTVEKVYFESVPGFYVTGNLYRPRKMTGRVPGVLFAHGHWQDARLAETGDAELLREIATGEERFLEGAAAGSSRSASNSPGWGAWCGSGTCWATPTPSSCLRRLSMGSPSSGPR
ncbi:MAG: hypothetical protein M5U12_24330 [Verrucomicrobia bacterium]|nr:hypothetical protein [Verrucomicrobiota bacterium]